MSELLITTGKLSLLPARIQSPTSLAELSDEELDATIQKYAGEGIRALATLRQCKPMIEEMRRRFTITKDYPPHPNGTPRTIAGCRTFEEYCNSVLNRTKQAVYKMLREEKEAAAPSPKLPYCERLYRSVDSIPESPRFLALNNERAMSEASNADLQKIMNAYRAASDFFLKQIELCKERIAFLSEVAEEAAADNA